VSTEQRDKLAAEYAAVNYLNKSAEVLNEVAGDFAAGWDAHAATMTDMTAILDALDALDWSQLEFGIAPSNTDIADAVLALLSKGGEE
jgi:hypothetical protein